MEIDVYSRKVVGWAFDTRMTTDLVVQALEMAAFTRKPQGVIHLSDQGSQYTSTVFGKRCEEIRPLHNLADHPAEARIMLILSRFA